MSQASPEQLESWIQGMTARDERAFAAFYDATSAMVFGLLVRHLKDRARAEDVAQDVYLQLWRNAKSFNPARGSAWSWIVVLARSRAIDALRSDGSYGSALSDLKERPMAQPMGSREPLPDRSAHLAQQQGLVQQAMEALSAPQRETIEAAFFEGWSHREIAERTGVPLGTVKGRIRSAFGVLEGLLSPRLGTSRGGT